VSRGVVQTAATTLRATGDGAKGPRLSLFARSDNAASVSLLRRSQAPL
jgi:hypothetical protein